MEITSIVIGVVLFGASLVYVNLPFQEKRWKGAKYADANFQPEGRRESVLAALRDLDFDFKTGKVTEEDYTPLRAQLMAKAAQLTRQEQEKEDKLEALIQSRRIKKEIYCDECGAPIETGQHFCSRCGSPVKQESCPSCGRRNKPADLFCTSCGTRLKVPTNAVGQA